VHCVGQSILITVAATYIAIGFPFCAAIFFFLQKFYLRTSRQLRLMELESKSSVYSQFMETINGLATIRAFCWGPASHSQNRKFIDVCQKPYYLLLSVQRWLNFSIDIIIAVIAIVLITITVGLRTVISPGYTGIALLNIMTFSTSVKMVMHAWTSLETSLGAISRIKKFATTTDSEDRPDAVMPDNNWPDQGGVEIRNLTASYK
jgi:ABC-type multidrug transport system fused ATPase/permease subunit